MLVPIIQNHENELMMLIIRVQKFICTGTWIGFGTVVVPFVVKTMLGAALLFSYGNAAKG